MINPADFNEERREYLERMIREAPSEKVRDACRIALQEWLAHGWVPSGKYVAEPMRLRDFTRDAWKVVEPSTLYVTNWHIDAVCEHLEAAVNGQIQNLLINVPPGTMKSLLVSVMFPSWIWTFKPYLRFLYASYDEGLSVRDSLKCRDIISSEWYQQNWGHQFRLLGDQNEKTQFKNDKTGYRLATSVGGSSTGQKCDIIGIDDPGKVTETGKTPLKRIQDWHDQAMSMRLNDPLTGIKIIVMQRYHEEDLSGHVISKELDFVHLMLPMRYEKERHCSTTIGFTDPRSTEGELLWKEKYPERAVIKVEKILGSYGTAGQLQQRPAPAGGGIFKREWFSKIIDAAPRRVERRIRYWDTAATEGDGDWSVGTKISRLDGIYYIEHVVRGQWSEFNLDKNMKSTAKADGPTVRIREEKVGAGGKAVTGARLRTLAGYDYDGDTPGSDKVTRARPFAAQAEGGNVVLVRGGWDIEAWLDEFAIFPNGSHDDQVDSVTGGFNEIVTGEWAEMGGIF